MSEPESRDARHSTRLLTALLWSGVGLAPVAVLVLLVGGSDTSTRFAVLLLAIAVVLVGAAQLVRTDPILLRDDAEQLVLAETDVLRGELAALGTALGDDLGAVRADLAAATAANRRVLDARLAEFQREPRRAAPPAAAPVADQTAGVRRSARVAPAEAPRPEPARPAAPPPARRSAPGPQPARAAAPPPGRRAAPDPEPARAAAPPPGHRAAAEPAPAPHSRRAAAEGNDLRPEPSRTGARRAAVEPEEDSGAFRPEPVRAGAAVPVRAAAAARVVAPDRRAGEVSAEIRPDGERSDGEPRSRQVAGAARVPVASAAVRVPDTGPAGRAVVSRGAAVVPPPAAAPPSPPSRVHPQSPAAAADGYDDVAWWAEEDVPPIDDFEREPPRRHRSGKSERW